MTGASRLRAAVYGDAFVPRWLNECIAEIEAEARETLLTELRKKVAAVPWNVAGQATEPVLGCDEEWAVGEYLTAILALVDDL